ncbi:neuroblast differentiation-associated protein AHNAK [Siniperca chuatsi]|uniref:neuroblast differentiation-associated protein AHNAK n=1 Tax=Siniperca chuatsi TaxID=119488 RepID=UPI001CE0EA86|nr:neuroblast differentiation-associated protein AHNAK [Siniperca chuatsi]
MSKDSKSRSCSESLVLGDSETGVVTTGITDDTITAKSGLQAGDEIVAATIHLDHLNKDEVLNILKFLEPYDNNVKVLTKKELSASAGLGSLGLGLKDPAQMVIPNKDLSLDASDEPPVVSLDGLRGKLNAAQGLGGKISGPTLNGDLPSLSVNKPSAHAGANITMPSVGLTGPDIKGDLDGTLKAPDVSVSTPQLNTPSASLDIEKPEIKTGNLKYKTPKFTMPHFNLPQLKIPKAETDVSGHVNLPSASGNLETPDLNLSAPNLDLKSPDLGLNGPKVDLNDPDVNLETPNAGIEAPSGKIKWPHLIWKGPKVKAPDANLNAAPDVNISTPKIDGDLSAPDVDINFPKADIKGPDLDVQTPNLDIDAPSGKINWPHLKWKKPKPHGPKADLELDANLNTPDVDLPVSKVEGGINAPNVDITLPKADPKDPDLDVQTPNIDLGAPSGKVNWPHQKWKKPKLQSPKADLDIDADPNTPNLNLLTPKIEGDINIPNAKLNLPKADLKGPNVDVQAQDLDIDAPSGKINWPHLKWKKPKLHGHKADMDLNADLSVPDVDVSVPKIDGEISTPGVDLNLSKADVDVKAPDADTEAPSGKIRFPTLKKPKFLLSGPKVKSPDVDLDVDTKAPDLSLSPQASLDGPDVDVNLPKADVDVKAPNVDIEGPSGKFKWPTPKKPKWSVSGPKVNGPDVDLDADVSAPDLSLSAPNIDGEINAPDANLNLPKADLEGPKLDAPNVEGPSGKFKLFTFKKPKFGTLKGPKADIDTDVKVPDVDVKPLDVDLSAPDVNLSAPNIRGGIEAPDLNISMPNADVKGPDVDLNGPDLNLDSFDGKRKLPKFKLPKFKGPKVKGPELDADFKAPDIDASLDLPKCGVDAPNVDQIAKIEGAIAAPDLNPCLPKANLNTPDVDINAPGKLKMPAFKMPKFNIGGPKAQLLDAELKTSDVSVPDLKLPTSDVKAPNLNLSGPTLQKDLNTPDLDLDANLETDIDLSPPKTNICLPDFNLSNPKIKAPDSNLPKADVKGPSLDLPKADLQVPDLNLKAPDLSMSPKIDRNLSAPNIDTKLPKAELQAPDVTLEAPNVDINLPKADLKGPDAHLKTPDLDFDSHLGDFKLPHFKLPKLGLSSPEVEVPSVNPTVEAGIEVPKVNIGTPTADANISVPAVDLSVPNVDANLEKSKLTHFKLPKLNFSGSNVKEVNSSANLEVLPDVKVKAPIVEGEISSTDVSVSAPEVKTSLNTPELDITAESNALVKGSPKSRLRWPFKWGLKSGSGTDEEGSGVDSETDLSNPEVEVPSFKFHRLPMNSIDGIGGIGDNLGLSKLDTEAKDYVVSKGVRLPMVNATSKAGEKIDIMERLKMAMENAPSAIVSPTELKTDIDLKLAAPNLDVNDSTEAGDSSLVRAGTFKVEKPESVLCLVAPEISTSDENDKLSLSLSNMLGLNIKDSDAD